MTWIDLDGAVNVRDVGGLPTVDGRQTRHSVARGPVGVQLRVEEAEIAVQRADHSLMSLIANGPLGEELEQATTDSQFVGLGLCGGNLLIEVASGSGRLLDLVIEFG